MAEIPVGKCSIVPHFSKKIDGVPLNIPGKPLVAQFGTSKISVMEKYFIGFSGTLERIIC
jgi:hypothetical protein